MTETTSDAPPPPQPGPPPMPAVPPRRLARDPDDKVVAGVCAAAGRFTGTDPVLWRVVIAALALFGGAGLALYALAWVLVPRVDSPTSFVERHLRKADRSVDVLGVVLLVVVTVFLLALLDEGSGVVVLVVVAGLAYLAARERGAPTAPGLAGAVAASAVPYAAAPDAPTPPAWAEGPPVPAPWPPAPPPYTGPGFGFPPFGPSLGPAGPVVQSRPPRPRSVLGPLTLSTAALLAGALLLLRAAGLDGVTAPRVLAAAMLVVGFGLVVGTWFGRARWLLAVGLALGLLLLSTALVDDRLADGAGGRRWVPTATTTDPDYRLGAGEAVLDLRELEPGALGSIRAEIGFGRMVVLVPGDLSVSVRTTVGLGEASLTPGGRVLSGDGEAEQLDLLDEVGVAVGPPGQTRLELDLRVGLGEIEVRRVEA